MRYEMFTDEGNLAVHRALTRRLALLRERRAEGFRADDQLLWRLTREVQNEVGGEAHDTAVREAIFGALERATKEG